VSQLDLAQSALLAGLPQAPSLYSPLLRPALALGRQQVVLQRMVTQRRSHLARRHDTAHARPPAQPFLRPPDITLATVSGYSGLLAIPGSGWTITDVFAPNDLPHQYDNPDVDNTAVPLWDPYSMTVHDGNWDYPGTQRYALPVGGPFNAPPS
jgi:Transglycosylase